jgi:hypothetical protein
MEETDKYKKLSKVMYAMTLDQRRKSYAKWRNRGFKKIHKKGENCLFNYWKNKLDAGDNNTQQLLDKHWKNYLQHSIDTLKTSEKKSQPQETPSLWKQAKSLGKAVAGFAKDGFNTATEEVVAARRAMCMSCDKWDAKAFAGMGRCTLCGCNTTFKTKMPREKCPIDKWLPVA